MKDPCVLLLSPGILKWTDSDFGLPHLVSLGGYLKQHTRVRVEILDLSYEASDREGLRRTLEELGPFLLIGVSCYSSFDYLRVMALARWLKRLLPQVPLVAGGYHPTAVPEDLAFPESPFDAVVAGEGELALREIVEGLLAGGARPSRKVYALGVVEDLDSLPPYQWDLLRRYWPRARAIGRKLQIYLGRGCPHHCTFCMERAKGGYRWRAFSPARALEELERLARHARLEDWVVNIADPLFGFDRRWRREVLEGIASRGLLPRQYWTLTRVDDLEDEDVALLARARFSIGVGLESGSPVMLERMQKHHHPEQYLARVERFAAAARKHRLHWAANLIVGHPGETPASLEETHRFARRLFTSEAQTTGWLSIDPFRLYPGSHVQAHLPEYAERYGTRVYAPHWWRSWSEAAFNAEHIDPGSELDYPARVRSMHEAYGPLVTEIRRRFRGQGASIDPVYERSLREQVDLLSDESRDSLLRRAETARRAPICDSGTMARPRGSQALAVPVGLHVRDPWIRRREHAVLRLLDVGVLQDERIVEAFLQVAPERRMPVKDALALLGERAAESGPAHPISLYFHAAGLEALAPEPGERAVDLHAQGGYMSSLLATLVGPTGSVVAVPASRFRRARTDDERASGVAMVRTARLWRLQGPFEVLWLGAALPRLDEEMKALMEPARGRIATFLGPRFRPQDFVCLRRDEGGRLQERVLRRVQVPALVGRWGWVRG